jgi:CHAT domain-containing protein/Flp pilus assembly protein TadD
MCRAGVAPYESAARGFAALGLPRRRAEALLGLGVLQSECLHDSEAALGTFLQLEPLWAGDPALESDGRQRRGELRFSRGDLDAAIGEYRRALELRRRLGDRAGEALTSSTLGHALLLRGGYDEAATLFDRALALWRPDDDPGKRTQTLINRGYLHRQLGEVDRARERFQEALALSRRAKDRAGEVVALDALGNLALSLGQPGAALEPLLSALALRSPGTRGRAVTLTSLGAAYRGLGRLEEARRAYAEALPIFERTGDVRERAFIFGNLGRLEAADRHDAAALADFDRAAGLFQTLAAPPDLAWALEGKARLLRRRGDLAAARGAMEEALATVEQHRFRQASYATRAAFFATQQSYYDFLIDLLMEMHRKAPAAGYAAAALEVSERSLARSLLDGLAAGGTDLHRSGAAPRLHAREQELETAIDALISRQAVEPPRSVAPELQRLWDELDRARAGLRAADPRYAALTQPRPWSAAEIQRRLLDRDTLLLEYRLGEERSFLWAATSGILKSFELPGRAAIERVARPACDLLARSRSRQAELSAAPRLAELSRLLLAPAASLLPGKRLLVVGDGVLQSLPFAALPEPAETGEPLVAHHEIVALPSVSVLGLLRRETAGRPAAPKTLWVLADPDFGGRFPPLPYTGQEAAAILAFAPAPQRFAVQGKEASRAAVLSGTLRDFRFLHFATHGSFAAGDPDGGRLVLAQVDAHGRPATDGFLHLADIYQLRLRADLVVLSACQSALGQEMRGEGMVGMTRGFFYAGAKRVLVSLWNVNDRVTVELMQRLYHGILALGLSPAAALREAQDAIRRQERWRSPYYWAGFTLQGER